MDLLSPSVPLDLYDNNWKIYSRNNNMPPQYIGDTADVENSMISEGSTINGKVDFSVILPGTVIKSGAVVDYAIVGEDCVVHENAKIGLSPETVENRDEWGIAVVGHNVEISEGAEVLPKRIL